MSKGQFDLFEQPPAALARGHSAEEVSPLAYTPKYPGNKFYLAAQELIHFVDYLKLNNWQQSVLWPHLQVLLIRIEKETREEILWFELGYIISAMEIEQIRSRQAAMAICAKYEVTL